MVEYTYKKDNFREFYSRSRWVANRSEVKWQIKQVIQFEKPFSPVVIEYPDDLYVP